MWTSYVFFLSDLYGLWFVPTYSIPGGYVHNFCIVWDLFLHIQFPQDVCTSFVSFLFDLYVFVPTRLILVGYVLKNFISTCSSILGM